MVAKGMCSALTSASWACTSGVTFWLLYTYTLIRWPRIWLSMVSLSPTERSEPSLIALSDGRRRDQVEPERRRQHGEDRLRRSHRRPRIARPDGAEGLGVRLEVDRHERALLPGEERTVGRVDPLIVGHHLPDDRLDIGRVVPAVRVAAHGNTEEGPDIERGGLPRVGGEQPRDPRVVADPVLHDELCLGQRAGIGSSGLIGVGIRIGIGNDTHYVSVSPAELGGDAPPEVLGRRHLDHPFGDRAGCPQTSDGWPPDAWPRRHSACRRWRRRPPPPSPPSRRGQLGAPLPAPPAASRAAVGFR